MIAQELISTGIHPIKTTDRGELALQLMADNMVRHLPIVDDTVLLGILSEEDVLAHNDKEPVGTYNLSLNRPYIQKDMHVFDIMAIMAEYRLTMIPIVDEKGTYIGVICLEDLLNYFARSFSLSEPGSILVLEMHKKDYSLAEISRIVESERAAILATFITTHPDSMKVHVTIKINKQEIGNILSTFDRYEIDVKASFTESEFYDSLQDRYDSLMNYLSV